MAGYQGTEPYQTGFLKVSEIHTIYYEQCGNPNGYPILFLHGGPGGGTSAGDRVYFDPSFFRIILIDQRGAGKSTPHACLEENTTWHLVEDIEKLRQTLQIEKWALFGGSWGSTLCLSYAETYPHVVTELILRGIFALRRSELLWFYQEGASHLFPDYWEDYVAPIPESERGDFINAYYRRLTGPDEAQRLACAKAWSTWECATSKLYVDPEMVRKAEDPKWALAFARIECHYFVNAGFFKEDGQLIKNAHLIEHIPTTIVQGRYDVVCPMKTAWDLYRQMPTAKFVLVNDAGHSAKESGTCAELIKACDNLRDKLKASGYKPAAAAASGKTSALPPAGMTMHKADYPGARYYQEQKHVDGVYQPSDPLNQREWVSHRKQLQPPGGKSSNIFG